LLDRRLVGHDLVFHLAGHGGSDWHRRPAAATYSV
jgi:hypothetical protein